MIHRHQNLPSFLPPTHQKHSSAEELHEECGRAHCPYQGFYHDLAFLKICLTMVITGRAHWCLCLFIRLTWQLKMIHIHTDCIHIIHQYPPWLWRFASGDPELTLRGTWLCVNRKKNGYFMVSLTVRVDPPPLLWSFFCEIFLRGAFDLELW